MNFKLATYGVLVAALLGSTVGFADVAVCTAQCDNSTSYQQTTFGGKTSGNPRTVKVTHTTIVQAVGKNVQLAFEKLSKKCSGQLYVGKNELNESDYTLSTVENSCDHE